jgi:hypothetical protein
MDLPQYCQILCEIKHVCHFYILSTPSEMQQ